ncbi:hypothetical protein H4219_006334 [Mycoemilia scoparia]|uniref:Uncharacterized protein n=1 Tax=Mycoemilia scoparia TaxID=417184 RepID=A0A9W8DM28_9FUNG|nr:hypothetical protein H4219_006334 [Mycoemilia scoparia]
MVVGKVSAEDVSRGLSRVALLEANDVRFIVFCADDRSQVGEFLASFGANAS